MGLDYGTLTGEGQLHALVESVARDGMLVLEVGSWLGGSACLLGKTVRAHNGHLFCIDWWKGSLSIPSMQNDAINYDVLALFRKRMQDAHLEDVVHPLIASTTVAASILRDGLFDLIFIDADHSYERVRADLLNYASKVRPGGIFCGHDCERRLADCNPEDVERYKDGDCHNGVHYGVVKAVGEVFPHHEMNDHIWWIYRAP